ncbi:MAG: lipoyl(octanoyl) transferase LipB [Acidobacteriota bacterium]
MWRPCEFRDLGRMGYEEAYALQRELVSRRKAGEIPDQLLFVEHPPVITMGRIGRESNILFSREALLAAGVEVHETDRGGDVTYHGPGQVVGYPIFDLREWKRDVGAYVRALEQVIIEAIGEFGFDGERVPGATGVWVGPAKVAAIGVHLSRWVSSHGFALNVETNLDHFKFIVPCGLTKPVTSLRALGCGASMDDVKESLLAAVSEVFEIDIPQPATIGRRA